MGLSDKENKGNERGKEGPSHLPGTQPVNGVGSQQTQTLRLDERMGEARQPFFPCSAMIFTA